MTADASNSRHLEILTTKMPVRFYIMAISLLALSAFFLVLAMIGRLDWPGAVFCFLVFGGIIYGCLGRYLARITLFQHRLEVNYVFPWNRSILFEYQWLQMLENDDRPDMLSVLSFTRDYAWYRQYTRLCLENEEGRVCEIRCNIDGACMKKLLKELQASLHPKK